MTRRAAGGLAVWVLLASACSSSVSELREACLLVEASPSLNLYDGQAHALKLLLYPLTTPTGFRQATIEDLVQGRSVDGMTGSPIPVVISPGEVRELREPFPGQTEWVGVVADYYQEGDEPGNRRAVVPAGCSLISTEEIALAARDLLYDED